MKLTRPVSRIPKSNRAAIPTEKTVVTMACVYLWTYPTKEDLEFAEGLYIRSYESEFYPKEVLEEYLNFAKGIGPKKREQVAWGYDIKELDKFKNIKMYYRLTKAELATRKKAQGY